MPSPVSLGHGDAHDAMHGWLWTYSDLTQGCKGGVESTWVMGPKDVPQPDISLRILPEYGGQSRVEGEYAKGAPELIVEVSGSMDGTKTSWPPASVAVAGKKLIGSPLKSAWSV